MKLGSLIGKSCFDRLSNQMERTVERMMPSAYDPNRFERNRGLQVKNGPGSAEMLHNKRAS